MKTLTPKTAQSRTDVLNMKRDNVDTKSSWMIFDYPKIIIANQRNGENSTGKVTLSRDEFERFIRFYETGR